MSAKKEKDDCCKDPHCEDSECLSAEERLKKLYTIPAEVASQLPAEGLKRLEAVIDLQKEHDEEYKNLVEEVRALQLRYEEKFVELYKKRQAIVVGEVDPASSDATKGISDFWFNVMKNSTLPIEEYDLEPLKSLTNVEYELLPENKGYKLSFHFAPNDFFSNSVLTKTFHIDGFMSQGEEDVYLIDGTEIDWKSGKNVTVKLTEKKVGGGGGGRGGGRGGKGKRGGKRGGGGGGGPTKTVLVEEEVPSFFRFFEPVPDIEKIDPHEDQEAYIMTLQQYQQDQYLGSTLKDKIIPQAPLYFNGVVMDDDSDDEDGLYEMGSDEDEDDDEDERALAAAFQSARSQAGGKKRGGGGGSGGRGGAGAGGAGGKPEGGLPFSFSAPAGGAAPAEGGAAAPFKFSFNPPAASGGAAPAAAASGEAAPFKFSFNAPPK